jgi:hypothetical protein
VFAVKELKNMPKIHVEQRNRRKKRNETAAVIASISSYSKRYVQMVMNGDRENDQILIATILYEQEKNKLIRKVKELVLFN